MMRVRAAWAAAVAILGTSALPVCAEERTSFAERFLYGGEVVFNASPKDPGYFNEADYRRNLLRLLRLNVALEFRAHDKIVFNRKTSYRDPLRQLGCARALRALYMRVRPWAERDLDFQIGRIPPVFGAFARRRYNLDNPLIGSPLAYQYPTTVRADAAPEILDQLIAFRGHNVKTRYPIGDPSVMAGLPLVNPLIPETLLESELFGHVKGAFTSATANKKGKFSLAHGSSILLDEIGLMSTELQAKLLRVLQEREFEPLGSETTQRVDVRVIASTNRDLAKLIAEGKFHEDLYYRLSVIPIELPSLRERREDIPPLVAHFVDKHRKRTGKRIESTAPEVLEFLSNYQWPGNVRELENTIERAVVLADGPEIGLSGISLPAAVSAAPGELPSAKLHDNVAWVERESIRRALDHAKGVKKTAADTLGISQRALSYYLKKFDFD